jgi:bifunctional DNA-binding transcriptional regulator/antitoxin component of YhaV-PrlF toxin-antitoxin module
MGRFVGVRGRGEIVLPADVRRRHRLDQPGAQVEVVEREDGVIELHPQVSVPADQAWFWTEAWQQGNAALTSTLLQVRSRSPKTWASSFATLRLPAPKAELRAVVEV